MSLFLYFQHNTFQGLVITNGSKSYSVFTYQCGTLDWGGEATIGYKADESLFRNDPLSGMVNVNDIACLNLPNSDWYNLVYDLAPRGKTFTHILLNFW